MLVRQRLTQMPVAGFVMNRGNFKVFFSNIVNHGKQTQLAHQVRREVLPNKTFIAVIAHGVVKRCFPIGARNVRKPMPIFLCRCPANALNVAEHGKAQCVRIDAVIRRVRDGRLVNNVGVRAQALNHETIA